MQDDGFWQLFADTGDPLGYLCYRAAQNALAQTTDESAADATVRRPA